MPQIQFDQIRKPEPVPADDYLAEIVHSEEAVSQAGNVMFKMRWQILSNTDGDTDHENRVVFDNLVFAFQSSSDVPLQRIKECMVACGWDADYDGDIEADEFVGKVARIGVTIRQSDEINPNTGEQYDPQNQVRNYKRLSEDELALIV